MGSGNIFLVGMMGAGKTTLGKALATRLRREFVDTDKALVEQIERDAGARIPAVFANEGEAGFRRRETAVLEELCGHDARVVATGGGVVLAEVNRQRMRESGTVVYLRARLENLWERTHLDTTRPLLSTADPRARIAELLQCVALVRLVFRAAGVVDLLPAPRRCGDPGATSATAGCNRTYRRAACPPQTS